MQKIERFTEDEVKCFQAWAVDLVKKHGASWGEVCGPIIKFAKAVKERNFKNYGDAIEEMETIENKHCS